MCYLQIRNNAQKAGSVIVIKEVAAMFCDVCEHYY